MKYLPQVTRRKFVRNAVVLAAGLPIASSFANAGNAGNKTPGEVPLKWLDSEIGAQTTGTTWGVPWPKGILKKNSSFVLENEKGVSIPLQSWQTAQWPDGSVKWTAHAVGPQANVGEKFILKSGKPQAITSALKVTETPDQISIDTGRIHCKINKKGKLIIDQIERDGKLAAKDGRLVLQVQNQPDNEPGEQTTTEFFQGDVKEAVLEQSGSVRAVVKITGSHVTENRSLLPFVVRLYFYDGSDAIRILHTIVYDADENKDFITGIGLRLQVPLEEEIHNRHVRFTGEENGVFAEAVRGLTGLRRDAGKAAIGAQLGGKATPATSEIPDNVSKRLHYIPAFGDYTLFQPTPDSFEIQKRTKAGHSWLQSAFGKRATGMAYVGSPKGGVLFGIRNFWQSHPAQLDIRNAHTDLAEITMWLWAPKSSAMDLRFYHDGMGQDTFEKQRDALEITYEDYEPEFGRPVGVARTSEMQLKIVAATPANAEISAFANALQSPAQLIAEPTYFAETGVFGGAFSVVSKGNPVEEKIDKQLDFYFDYYHKQVDQHKWYGFWNYGDVMHAYDYDRHTWRYDVGGYAWDNSELSTDLWLWYYFLRTGRSDVFRMAEAMTRHTGEVDVHHIGPFSPLGSRHNVMHWGCSAKQLRISTAANRRFYYYLTADERVGDLMKEQVDADKTLRTIIPGRKIGQKAPENDPKGELASISFGTDWGALASAWLTEWERTGDEKMKTKLLNSMKTIAAQPHGFFTGVAIMDLNTGKFQMAQKGKLSVSHLSAVFGLAEICAELISVFDMPDFEKAWVQYCELYNATPEEQKRVLGQVLTKLNLRQGHARLTAFASMRKKDPKLANRAWDEFFEGGAGIKSASYELKTVTGPEVMMPIEEAKGISTNAVAQWGLAAMQCLAFAGKYAK